MLALMPTANRWDSFTEADKNKSNPLYHHVEFVIHCIDKVVVG